MANEKEAEKAIVLGALKVLGLDPVTLTVIDKNYDKIDRVARVHQELGRILADPTYAANKAANLLGRTTGVPILTQVERMAGNMAKVQGRSLEQILQNPPIQESQRSGKRRRGKRST